MSNIPTKARNGTPREAIYCIKYPHFVCITREPLLKGKSQYS